MYQNRLYLLCMTLDNIDAQNLLRLVVGAIHFAAPIILDISSIGASLLVQDLPAYSSSHTGQITVSFEVDAWSSLLVNPALQLWTEVDAKFSVSATPGLFPLVSCPFLIHFMSSFFSHCFKLELKWWAGSFPRTRTLVPLSHLPTFAPKCSFSNLWMLLISVSR